MTMNNFTEAENKGREKMKTLCKEGVERGTRKIEFTEDRYCPYDLSMTSKTGTSVGEIKNLERPYSQYPNFQIDLSKLRNLLRAAEEKDSTPLLFAFFTDCTLVWDISTLSDKIEERAKTVWCTNTTADRYNRGHREKTETFLYSDETLWSGGTIL